MNTEAREMLGRYKQAKSPGETVRAAGLERIQARIAAGDPGPPLGGEGSGRLALAAKSFVAGLAVAAAGFGAWSLRGSDEPEGMKPTPTATSTMDARLPSIAGALAPRTMSRA